VPESSQIPILVGVGSVSQRCENPLEAAEPLVLMERALNLAAEDAGSKALLADADSIRIPRGFWGYPNPGRWIGDRIGAKKVRTQVAEVGVLQTTLLGQAARDISEGRAQVVLIAGGEAKYRMLREKITGQSAPITEQPPGESDEVLRPKLDLMHPLEIEVELVMPVRQYSMVENGLRAAEGLSISAHRDEVARIWSAMSEVASRNPEAWSRTPIPMDAIRDGGAQNPMLAFPYTKLHNSQWNVDQAAGLILCSAEKARALGIPEERWIYPLAITESNHMLPLCEREEIHRCPGFRIAGERAFELAGRGTEEIEHREIYSCFPSAVRVQARELGLDPSDSLTETGGMAFAGGPLNNFVIQATAHMATVLRKDRGSTGLVTCVSGILTKQGVTLWSSDPGQHQFGFEDVTEEVRAVMPPRPLDSKLSGPARVITYTVLDAEAEAARGVLLCEMEDGRRSLAVCDDPARSASMTLEEYCGREVELRAGKLC
jgi:acetyl-CoA C-acetyltransferase